MSVGRSLPTLELPNFRTLELPRAAFTLIEMLIVISIISVLLGLLYGSLERARTFSRRAVAYTEVKNIEAALKQYYAHYHTWPPDSCIEAASEQLSGTGTSANDKGFVIDNNLARMLQGTFSSESSDTLAQNIKDANPDRIPFIEFSRKNSAGTPINPFRLGTTGETRQYKVLFDLNNDSYLEFSDSTATFHTNAYASVVVWTVIPGSSSSDNSGNTTVVTTYEVLGSWSTFSK